MPAKKSTARAAVFHLSAFLPFKLGVVTDSMARIFADHYLDSYNLTISEWRALAVIAEHGTLSPTVVGQRAAMDKVRVSRATQSLVAKGLLRQTQDPGDGRGRLLHLTRKGASTHAGMAPLAEQVEAAVLTHLTQSEKAALNRILTKIITHFETTGGTGVGPV